MPAADNFAWTLHDPHGNLLAYQEKPITGQPAPQPEIVDKEKAVTRCQELVLEAMNDGTLDYHLQVQAFASTLYIYRKVMGFEEAPKSKIILPGQR